MRTALVRSVISVTAAVALVGLGIGYAVALPSSAHTGTGKAVAQMAIAKAVPPAPRIDVGFATSSAVARLPAKMSAPSATSSAPGPPKISGAHLRFGIGTPGGLYDNSELPPVEAAVGEVPSIVLAYSDFTQAAPIAGLDAVSSRGQTPMLTWEPWQAGGVDQPSYSLSHLIAGDYDTYIRSWATALNGWGKPMMLRFAHEMNGNWYPWSEQVNGNRPGQYVAAWRHIHDIFTSVGDHNVSWVWSPNVAYTGSIALSEVYPGAGYVDVVAMDGYNWGATRSYSVWTSPADLFGATLAQFRSIATGLPIIIGETASAESGGSKPDWISSLVAYLRAQPDVTALVWFDYNKEADWRINSSDASVAAVKAALASRR